MTIKPDGFFGTVMAIEGMEDAVTLLHGPHGCRLLISATSGMSYYRPDDACNMGTPFYRGNPRVPNTDVVSPDFIYGAYAKVLDALKFIQESRDPPLIAVVCSPGASLIGDDCQRAAEEAGVADKTIVLDAKVMSKPFNHGLDYATAEALNLLIPEKREHVKGRVNLLGVNIFMKDWSSLVEEFTDILVMMGLEVVCPLCAGNSVQDIRDSATAEYNVVLCPEFAREASRFYSEVHGIPSVGLPYAPVGFRATADFINAVAEATGADPSKALEYNRRIANRAYKTLENGSKKMIGRSFTIDACPSVAYPMVRMLYEDLAMVPAHIEFDGIHDDALEALVREFLDSNGLSQRVSDRWPDWSDYVFADCSTAYLEEDSGHCYRGIGIGYPNALTVDFRRSHILGPTGMLYLLDRIVNEAPN